MNKKVTPSAKEQLKAVRARHKAWKADADFIAQVNADIPDEVNPFPTEEQAWEAEADQRAAVFLIAMHEARDDLFKSKLASQRAYLKLKRVQGCSPEMMWRVDDVLTDVEKEL